MKKTLSTAWNRAVALFFPPKCPLCGEVTGSRIDGALCEKCRSNFHNDYTVICPRCNHSSADCTCAPDVIGSEYDRSPFTDVYPLIFDGYYTGYSGDSVSTLVYKMKRNSRSGAALFFAGIIAARISRELTLRGIATADMVVTFIPRSKTALKRYGFDHMEIVSKRVSRMLGCGFASYFVRKGGTDQKTLSSNERASNAANSIFVNPKTEHHIQNKKIIVIDDIITTGATMRVAVSKLSFAGAKTVIPAAAMISKTKKIV